MEFHGIPIGSIWTFVQWLPAAALRKFFPKERLAALQHVDLRPRNDPVTVNLGESASFEIWVNAFNLSPFEVELDRAEFEFWYAGTTLNASVLRREKILPGDAAILRLAGPIPDCQANLMAKNIKANHDRLDGMMNGYIEFNSKLLPFTKDVGNLSGIRPRLMNEKSRE
jgi:hypothetical protein